MFQQFKKKETSNTGLNFNFALSIVSVSNPLFQVKMFISDEQAKDSFQRKKWKLKTTNWTK